MMKSDQQLDISGEMLPVSLALCKSALSRMAAGAVLEVQLQDQATLQDLLMILARSRDNVLAWENRDDRYSLWVRKGPRP